MSKKLNKNSIRQIKKNKDKIQERFYSSEDKTYNNKPILFGVVTSRYSRKADVLTQDDQIVKCFLQRTSSDVVVGDNVLYQYNEEIQSGVIISIEERRTEVLRPNFYEGMKTIAANIDQIVIVSALQPALNNYIIDCYILASQKSNIDILIVINKIDLLTPEDEANFNNIVSIYEELGHKVITISADNDINMDSLRECLANKTSVLVGQSGVGKTSIINCLDKNVNAKVQQISALSKLGTHTTTTSVYYKMQCDFIAQESQELESAKVIIIDSPGIRQFGMWYFTPQEILEGFTDIYNITGDCKFRNCNHLSDLGCAVVQAVETGNLNADRYNSFKSMLDARDNIFRNIISHED